MSGLKEKRVKQIFLILFFTCVLFLIYAKFLHNREYSGVMVEPIGPVYNWTVLYEAFNWQIHWWRYLANLMIFSITCFSLNILIKRKLISALIMCASSLILELLQPIFKTGVFDIRTVIFEFIGIGIGFLLAFLTQQHLNKSEIRN